jgi:hypothetical protein
MLFADSAGSLLVLALWIFCLIDVITTDEGSCRNLSKTWWLVIVFIGFDLGAIVWLVAGRPWQSRSGSYAGRNEAFPEYDRPGRFAATSSHDDDAFLRDVRARAEEQRARYRAEQRERQQAEEQAREERQRRRTEGDPLGGTGEGTAS